MNSVPFPLRFEWSKNIVLLQNKFFFIWKSSCANNRNMILHFFKLTKNIRKLYINNSMTSLLNVEIAFFFYKSTQSQGKPFLKLLGQRMLYIFYGCKCCCCRYILLFIESYFLSVSNMIILLCFYFDIFSKDIASQLGRQTLPIR